jgi:hypothetical protein
MGQVEAAVDITQMRHVSHDGAGESVWQEVTLANPARRTDLTGHAC